MIACGLYGKGGLSLLLDKARSFKGLFDLAPGVAQGALDDTGKCKL